MTEKKKVKSTSKTKSGKQKVKRPTAPKAKRPAKAATTSKTKTNKGKEDFVSQNIKALFLLIFGMVFLISITTNALGPLGLAIKSILLGQFALIAVFMSLAMISIGTARLVYNSKFSLDSISPVMVLLIFIASIIFYGGVKANSVQAENMSLILLRAVFVESVVGENIGILPYITSFYLKALMGKMGMLLTAMSIYLFVALYYFKLSFARLGDLGAALAKENGRFFKNIKERVLDFITIKDEDEKKKKKERKKPEKLDKTMIDGKFVFMNNYQEDIEEFIDSENEMEILKNQEDSFKEEEPLEEAELPIRPAEDRFVRVWESRFEQPGEASLNQQATRPYEGLAQALAEVLDEKENHSLDSLEKKEEAASFSPSPSPSTSSSYETTPMELGSNQASESYHLPSLEILKTHPPKEKNLRKQEESARKLEETLEIFGIDAKVVNVSEGPTITRYELQPKMGVKVSKILNLTDDLALALAAVAPIRIEAPIPGTSLIGIEVPNVQTSLVAFKDVLADKHFEDPKKDIPIALGKDISGKAIIEDIARMPHLLVAGSTGSGKSVCINTLICSILYKFAPQDIKLIMIDPKMVELSVYNDIPHLLIPVVTDMKKAPYALSWAVNEMNKRYKLFTESRVRDLAGYNAKEENEEKLPRIVIIVDELADLMMVSPNEVEDSIIRLAQKARACGIHLVIATQRPSVDVITGLIKANIPSRIAFAVSSQVDSRTILDQVGAEKLIGKGDMLFSHPSIPKPQRIQGAFISDKEVNDIVDHILKQYPEKEEQIDIIEETMQNFIKEQEEEEKDPLLDQVIEFAIKNQQLSTSLVQRRFKVGYNRASRMIDCLEEMGVISESDGAKPRKVLISSSEAID